MYNEKNLLKNNILSGSTIPNTAFEAIAWISGTALEISVDTLNTSEHTPDETILFFWNYDEKKPLHVRYIEPTNGTFTIKIENILLLQMRYLGYEGMRIAIAFRYGDKINCGFLRNMVAKKEEYSAAERQIGKLFSTEGSALVAYWTEGGVLSVHFRKETDYDAEFYQMCITGYQWEDSRLLLYIESPLMKGEPVFTLNSYTTEMPCETICAILQDEHINGIRRIWKLALDFSDIEKDEADRYHLICELDGLKFQMYMTTDVSEIDDVKEILTNSGERLSLCVIRNMQGQFQIQTGVYPVMLSVVTAVYNTAPFLAEMIDSVLTQDIEPLKKYLIGNTSENLKDQKYKNIFELILVDDGSTDGSGEILDEYARLSDTIRVIHKENGGVSSARNAGMDVARGKYINFADSDDKLSKNFFSECLTFFEEHENKIDFVTTPLKFFDASTGDHWTNYKFQKNNQMIDLNKTPEAITVSTCCTVFKTSSLMGKFDTSLVNGEDIFFIYNLLINGNHKIGNISKCHYLYRRRSIGELSAIAGSANDGRTYTKYLSGVLERLLLNSKNKNGYIPKYVQHTVMGQLQWKFQISDRGEKAKKILGEIGFKKYKEKAISLLQYIDDDVILSQKKIWSEHFYYMLKHKYGKRAKLICENNDAYFYFDNTRISTSLGNSYIRPEFLTIKDNVIHMEGYAMNFEPDIQLNIYVNDQKVPYTVVNRDVSKYTMDDICFYATPFSVNYKLDKTEELYEIRFTGSLDGIEVAKRDFRYAKTMPLAQSYKKSYYMEEGWAIRKEGNSFMVYNLESEVSEMIPFEQEFISEIQESKNVTVLQNVLELRQLALRYLVGKDKKKKIWLLSDRPYEAGDNAEAIFRYLSRINDPNVDAYFILEEGEPDFTRMKKFGKVVARGSQKHLMLHLTADYIVSSAADEFVINPWSENKNMAEIVRDFLARPKFIFLQHGIIKDDMSQWLNRYNKNMTGFVCAASREAQSILDCDYYYQQNNVWLTGLPRHDRLYHNERNYITIMPTWRQWLAKSIVPGGKQEQFTASDYFIFYNKLINNETLLKAATTYGYQICFMPHPSVQLVLDLFLHDDRVMFFSIEKPYKDIYAESNLVITDYSSACMDFALLRKPVVYCQFDKEEFFSKHIYKPGYFDYERDGFGEVTYDMESLVDTIISYMKDGCRVHEPYGSRMDNFFAYHDQNNCERVYRKIRELDYKEEIGSES